MRTSALLHSGNLPVGLRLRLCRAALGVLLLFGILQAPGQITISPATISTPVIQPVPGNCSDYQAKLTTTGVQSNGISHPGFCAKSHFTPLFNGQPIGTTWQQLMLGPNPPKFTLRRTTGRQTCITASNLTVDLSARIDVSELNWAPAQTVGPVCTNETTRVNTAPMASTQTLQASAQTLMGKTRHVFAPKLGTPISVCGSPVTDLRPLLDEKIWTLLNTVATTEQHAWNDPENANAGQCVPQCNLCNPGWVGTITCTKTVRDTSAANYTWDEVQTWVVGGTPSQQMVYPATFTAKGGGSKTGISWKVNLTSQDTLNVSGTQQSPTFQTSQIRITKGITSTPAGYEADAIAYQIPPFQLSPNTFTYGSLTPAPNQNGYPCDTPMKPGAASCKVDCTWNLSYQ
jgi:hypothetical protein